MRGRGTGVALWILAAAISSFTVRRYLEPFDEGLLLQAASRIAAGQWPYADFGWPYGPGQPLVVAAAFKALGPSVLWWRLLRVAADATVALLVWALVRRPAGDRWALAAWLAAAVTVAQPTSANPFPVALAFALAATLAAARGRPLLAGTLAALTVFWRLDAGVVAIAAAAIAALAGGRPERGAPPGGRRARAGERPAVPRGGGLRAAVTVVAAAIAGVALLYAPFVVVAGPGRMYDALVGTAAGDGTYWRLPFPLDYDGRLRLWPPGALARDGKDVLGFYLPLAGLVGAAAVALALVAARRRPRPELAGGGVLALGSLAYLLTRPDELHAQPLLTCLCALLPLAAAATAVAARPRGLAVPLAVVLGLLVLAGAANRLSALLLPPDLAPVHLAGVPGIGVPPAEAAALPRLAARVDRLVPPGRPIYVAPRRSDLVTLTDPLIHFLTHRPTVLHRDVLLQARPAEQARIVAALSAARPRAIVRWTDPASDRPEPNARGRPSGSTALDEYLRARYRLDARYGAYDVLVPR